MTLGAGAGQMEKGSLGSQAPFAGSSCCSRRATLGCTTSIPSTGTKSSHPSSLGTMGPGASALSLVAQVRLTLAELACA